MRFIRETAVVVNVLTTYSKAADVEIDVPLVAARRSLHTRRQATTRRPRFVVHVSRLWRYPVKSLGGEPLDSAHLTLDGIAGDRVVHVRGAHGPVTGRTRHGLLTVPADTDPDGVPRVDGHRWDSAAATAAVRVHAGPQAELVAHDGPGRFDIANLLVATDGAVARFASDVRRLRPNLLLAGVPDGAETTWAGRALAIGDALIGVHSPRQRCIVTSIDPDTGAQDLDVFRRIRRDFDNELALNCWVIRPGRIEAGAPVELVDTAERPDRLGGWVVGAPYPGPAAGPGV